MRNLMKSLRNKKLITDRLVEYGFVEDNKRYIYSKKLVAGNFLLEVFFDNEVFYSKVIDLDINDEYLLVDVTNSTGEFVGKVKDEYEDILNDIINKCSILDVFKEKQSKQVINYIKDKYNDDLEFLWQKYDNNAIWRNKENNKWYGALLTVNGCKIDGVTDKDIEIIDLRYQKDKIEEIIDNKYIYPGYHMNKKSWITIKLDGSIEIDKIFTFIDNSYNISLNKK